MEATTPKSNSAVVPPRPKLTRERRKKIEELASLDHLSAKDKQKLLDLLFKHHKCLSLSEFDLGCCRIGSHNIPTIPGAPPAYSKQFPLGYEQEMEVRRQILEWIKLQWLILNRKRTIIVRYWKRLLLQFYRKYEWVIIPNHQLQTLEVIKFTQSEF